MKFTDINEAIAHSENCDERATVIVADKAAAQAAIAEARQVAETSGLEFDHTDTNNGWDVWANEEDAMDGDMKWRLSVVIDALVLASAQEIVRQQAWEAGFPRRWEDAK